MKMFFDYVSAANRAGIPRQALEKLREYFHAEFPDDEMMAELHLLRAVLSIERRDTTIDDILSQTVTS
jgi:hypothetical protein